MTKLRSLVLAFCAIALFSVRADSSYNGWKYNLIGDKAIITGTENSSLSGAVAIPSKVGEGEEYDVVAIGASAFSGNQGITSVTIPEGVTNIGAKAFSGCTALANVSFPGSTKLIGTEAFKESGIKSVVISGCGDLRIVASCFSDCSELKDFEINSSGFCDIRKNVLGGCVALTNISVTANEIAIGEELTGLAGITSKWPTRMLQSVALSSATSISINHHAFFECGSLESVKLTADGAVTIAESSFNSCGALTSIDIPATTTTIGNLAFTNCLALLTIRFFGDRISLGSVGFNTDALVLYNLNDADDWETELSTCGFTHCIPFDPANPDSVLVRVDVQDDEGGSVKLLDAAGDEIDSQVIVERHTNLTAVATADAGWHFNYWYDQENESAGVSESNFVFEVVSNVSLVAVFEKNTYTITFNSNGGTSVQDMNYEYGSDISDLAGVTSTKDGYDFDGWYEGDDKYVFDTMPASNLFLQARWVETTVLTFDGNGGTLSIDSVVARKGKALPDITDAEVPTRAGYTFDGFYCGDTQYYDEDMDPVVDSWELDDDELTLKAGWTPIAYTVSFVSSEGEGEMDDLELVYDAVTNLPPCAFSNGDLSFRGWAAEDGGEVLYVDGAAVSNLTEEADGDVELYAVWGEPAEEFSFGYSEVEANKSDWFELPINGGSDKCATSVKLNVTYWSAKAGDLVLKNASIDGVTPKGGIKFPLTLTWEQGDRTPKFVLIPTAAGKATDAPKYLTWNLSNATGAELGENSYCIGTIAAGDSYSGTEAYVLPYVANISEGKVSGGASSKASAAGVYKTVTLKASPVKGYWFDGWYKEGEEDEGDELVSCETSYKATPDSAGLVAYEAKFFKAPSWGIGTFNGHLDDGTGSAVMTISSAGKISGKIITLGKTWSFSANGCRPVDEDGDGEVNGLEISAVAKNGKLLANLELSVSSNRVVGVVEPDESCEDPDDIIPDGNLTLWRNEWKDAGATDKLAPWVGLYTVQLESEETGYGYLSLTIDKKGNCKATGKLPDGVSASATLPLVWNGAENAPMAVWQVSPSAYKGGWVGGLLQWSESFTLRVNGDDIAWASLAPTASSEYGDGFERDLSAAGAYYDKLATLADYYTNSLAFSADAPELDATVKTTDYNESGKKATTSELKAFDAVELVCMTNLSVSLNAKGTAFVVDQGKATKPVQDKTTKEWSYGGANDAALTISFTKATGIFKGSFTCWYDYVSATDKTKDPVKETVTHVSKKVSYEGITVLEADENDNPVGEDLRGFYLWERTGSYTDAKTGKGKTFKYKESHPVEFESMVLD